RSQRSEERDQIGDVAIAQPARWLRYPVHRATVAEHRLQRWCERPLTERADAMHRRGRRRNARTAAAAEDCRPLTRAMVSAQVTPSLGGARLRAGLTLP